MDIPQVKGHYIKPNFTCDISYCFGILGICTFGLATDLSTRVCPLHRSEIILKGA